MYEKRIKRLDFKGLKETYIAIFVGDVVSEFHFVKWNGFLHPLSSSAGRIRMHVQWFWHLWVRFACHHPATIVKLVSAIIGWDNVHEKEIFRPRVQPCHARLDRRKHSPVDRIPKTLGHELLEINMGDEINNGSWPGFLIALHLKEWMCSEGDCLVFSQTKLSV